jgi:hypothetical protein
LDLGPPVGRPIQYRLSGPDLQSVRQRALSLGSVLASNPHVDVPTFDWNEPGEVLRVEILQDKARALGITSQDIANFLNGVVGGSIMGLLSSFLGAPELEHAAKMFAFGNEYFPPVVGFLAFLGVALYQGYKGISKKFLDDSKTGEMSPSGKRAFTAIGVFGHLARMVVFGMVGYFLVKAALDYSPAQAVGLDGVLARLVHNSYGPVLLGIDSAGLIAFALYSICDARYRKI